MSNSDPRVEALAEALHITEYPIDDPVTQRVVAYPWGEMEDLPDPHNFYKDRQRERARRLLAIFDGLTAPTPVRVPEDGAGASLGRENLLTKRLAWETDNPRPEQIVRAERAIVRALKDAGFESQHQVTHQDRFEIAVDDLLVSVVEVRVPVEAKDHSFGTRVYVAGPMSGLPHHNIPAFQQEATRLRDRGLLVWSPVEKMTPAQIEAAIAAGQDWVGTGDYARLLADDIKWISQAGAVQLLPGWENSKGAKAEVAYALAIGVPVWAPFSPEAENQRVTSLVDAPFVVDQPVEPYTDDEIKRRRPNVARIAAALDDHERRFDIDRTYSSGNRARHVGTNGIEQALVEAGYLDSRDFTWTDAILPPRKLLRAGDTCECCGRKVSS